MSKTVEHPLTTDEIEVIRRWVNCACSLLGVEYGSMPSNNIIARIDDTMTRWRKEGECPLDLSNVSFDGPTDDLLDTVLGALFGQLIIDIAKWHWASITNVSRFGEGKLLAVVSPEGEMFNLCDIQMEKWRKGEALSDPKVFVEMITRAPARFEPGAYHYVG